MVVACFEDDLFGAPSGWQQRGDIERIQSMTMAAAHEEEAAPCDML
jgi:hypothetical protein